MSDFKQTLNILRREFFKRTTYTGEQFYDYKVVTLDDSIDIEITSSQQTRAHISGNKATIGVLISDLQEIIKL